jgi:hypothetical protein
MGADARDAATADATDAAAADASDANDFADIGTMQIDAPTLVDFPHAVDEAFCTRLMQCCIMSTDIASPAQWNQDGEGGCAPLFDQFGGAFGIGKYDVALDSGLVGYDASAANSCLLDWLSFQCGTVSAAGFAQARLTCFGAMSGTLGVDAGPCVNSLECHTGEYCRLGDAGTGTCAALSGPGQPCSDTTSSTDCDYLGLGSPPLYCAPGDAGPTCQNTLPADAGCGQNAQCQSGVCLGPRCVDTQVFSSSPTCRSFAIKDAGGGG